MRQTTGSRQLVATSRQGKTVYAKVRGVWRLFDPQPPGLSSAAQGSYVILGLPTGGCFINWFGADNHQYLATFLNGSWNVFDAGVLGDMPFRFAAVAPSGTVYLANCGSDPYAAVNSKIFSYDGSVFEQFADLSPTINSIDGLWVVSDEHIWAIGRVSDWQSAVMHYDGSTFFDQTSNLLYYINQEGQTFFANGLWGSPNGQEYGYLYITITQSPGGLPSCVVGANLFYIGNFWLTGDSASFDSGAVDLIGIAGIDADNICVRALDPLSHDDLVYYYNSLADSWDKEDLLRPEDVDTPNSANIWMTLSETILAASSALGDQVWHEYSPPGGGPWLWAPVNWPDSNVVDTFGEMFLPATAPVRVRPLTVSDGDVPALYERTTPLSWRPFLVQPPWPSFGGVASGAVAGLPSGRVLVYGFSTLNPNGYGFLTFDPITRTWSGAPFPNADFSAVYPSPPFFNNPHIDRISVVDDNNAFAIFAYDPAAGGLPNPSNPVYTFDGSAWTQMTDLAPLIDPSEMNLVPNRAIFAYSHDDVNVICSLGGPTNNGMPSKYLWFDGITWWDLTSDVLGGAWPPDLHPETLSFLDVWEGDENTYLLGSASWGLDYTPRYVMIYWDYDLDNWRAIYIGQDVSAGGLMPDAPGARLKGLDDEHIWFMGMADGHLVTAMWDGENWGPTHERVGQLNGVYEDTIPDVTDRILFLDTTDHCWIEKYDDGSATVWESRSDGSGPALSNWNYPTPDGLGAYTPFPPPSSLPQRRSDTMVFSYVAPSPSPPDWGATCFPAQYGAQPYSIISSYGRDACLVSPYLEAQDPAPDATNVPLSKVMSFRVRDTWARIIGSTLRVYLRKLPGGIEQVVYDGSGFVAPYNGPGSSLAPYHPDGYAFLIECVGGYDSFSTYQVRVAATDMLASSLDYPGDRWSFETISSFVPFVTDVVPPIGTAIASDSLFSFDVVDGTGGVLRPEAFQVSVAGELAFDGVGGFHAPYNGPDAYFGPVVADGYNGYRFVIDRTADYADGPLHVRVLASDQGTTIVAPWQYMIGTRLNRLYFCDGYGLKVLEMRDVAGESQDLASLLLSRDTEPALPSNDMSCISGSYVDGYYFLVLSMKEFGQNIGDIVGLDMVWGNTLVTDYNLNLVGQMVWGQGTVGPGDAYGMAVVRNENDKVTMYGSGRLYARAQMNERGILYAINKTWNRIEVYYGAHYRDGDRSPDFVYSDATTPGLIRGHILDLLVVNNASARQFNNTHGQRIRGTRLFVGTTEGMTQIDTWDQESSDGYGAGMDGYGIAVDYGIVGSGAHFELLGGTAPAVTRIACDQNNIVLFVATYDGVNGGGISQINLSANKRMIFMNREAGFLPSNDVRDIFGKTY